MFHAPTPGRHRLTVTAGLIGVVALLAGCGTENDPKSAAAPAEATGVTAAMPSSEPDNRAVTVEPAAGSNSPSTGTAEEPAAKDRLTLTYDGGILVLDAETLDTVANLPLSGFNRLNPAGDGDHVFVTTDGGFRVLSTGTNDGSAELTGLTFSADTPGHVVRHAGTTALFDDGTGRIQLLPTDALLDGSGTVETLPAARVAESGQAHHGVAVELADGTLLGTIGTSENRTGVYALAADGSETSRSQECPSVHGEGVLAEETVVFGCQDGLLVYSGGAFTKLDSPDEFGRIGNAYVSDTSSIAVVDYKDDPDAEGVELSHIALADTADLASAALTVLDLPADTYYTWRGIARDGKDDAWILGTDGALHRVDVSAGTLGASYPVIKPWRGPTEWQTAHPALVVDGDVAYVTEPAAKAVHRVDLRTGKVLATAKLPNSSNEVALVTVD